MTAVVYGTLKQMLAQAATARSRLVAETLRGALAASGEPARAAYLSAAMFAELTAYGPSEVLATVGVTEVVNLPPGCDAVIDGASSIVEVWR
jgi:hypothetical protein